MLRFILNSYRLRRGDLGLEPDNLLVGLDTLPLGNVFSVVSSLGDCFVTRYLNLNNTSLIK